MKSIVPMLFVIATALLLTSPAQAGYADGMNQYAGYHIMHGGVDPTGTLSFQSVGNGPQTHLFGKDKTYLNVWAAASVMADADELGAGRAAGGAALVYQRDSSWSIEGCDSNFSYRDFGTTWHFDHITFAADGSLIVNDPLGGNGGPTLLADGSTAIAYINLLHTNTLSLQNRALKKLLTDMRDRSEQLPPGQEIRAMSIECTKGEIRVAVDAKYYIGDQSWSSGSFERKPSRSAEYNLKNIIRKTPRGSATADPEFVHKPWSIYMPRIYTYGEYSSASASLVIKWDACDKDKEVQITIEGDSNLLPPGPQRKGREQNPGYTVWDPDGNAGWMPSGP
ncbi:MAG: hypothetical protein AAGI37_08310 [Planctomycetota bacterium]